MTTLSLLVRGAAEVFPSGGDPVIPKGVVGVIGGRVVHVGTADTLAAAGLVVGPGTQVIDAEDGLVTPGLVDPHTHLVFAGDRAHEYALRAHGASYQEIARAGGGIAHTMAMTRKATEEELIALAAPRLDRLLRQGVTTAEVKSGYGLDLDSELKLLRVIRRLDRAHPVDLVPTFLGAHVVPPEYRGDRARYVNLVVHDMLPEVAREGLAAFCDVFVEDTAFHPDEAVRILRAASALGLKPKLHVDQLSDGGGARLAASVDAVSADHLEHAGVEGIRALAKAGTAAVLLPGATLFLGQSARPPARALLDAGVPVALATDCNPGTCPTENLPLMLTLGMSLLGLSPTEVLRGVTDHAARAIGRGEVAGHLAAGRPADLVVFDVPSHVHLPYHFGTHHARVVVKHGQVAWRRPPEPSLLGPLCEA
ncbi:imidazolonepropionase [Myxococcota bacterium]|nr:imidazolonepropionase [Myxococcota bacterium]